MVDSSLGIAAALQATGDVSIAVNSTIPGWGLTTDTTWPGEVAQTLAQSRPQLAIGTWSWDFQAAQADPAAYRAELGAVHRRPGGPARRGRAGRPRAVPPDRSRDSLTDPVARREDWTTRTALAAAWNAVARQAVAAFPAVPCT